MQLQERLNSYPLNIHPIVITTPAFVMDHNYPAIFWLFAYKLISKRPTDRILRVSFWSLPSQSASQHRKTVMQKLIPEYVQLLQSRINNGENNGVYFIKIHTFSSRNIELGCTAEL